MAKRKVDPHTTPHPQFPGRTVSGRMMPTNKEMVPKASGPKPSPKPPPRSMVPAPKASSMFSNQKPPQKRKAKKTK